MNFTITKTELLSALSIAGKVIPNSIIDPILNNFLFNIDGNDCEICASNQEVFISKKVVCKSEIKHSVTIPAVRLSGLVRELPEQPLLFTIEANQVKIKSSSGEYIIPTTPADDFPHFDVKDEPLQISVPGKDLLNAADKTIFAAFENMLAKTNGLCIDINEAGTTLTGCNNTILSTVTIGDKNEVTKRVVLPYKMAKVLCDMPESETVLLEVREKNISFSSGNTLVISSILNSQYVDWQAVIPLDNPCELSVDREQLIGSIKRVVQFSNKTDGIIRLSISENNIAVTGEDIDFNESAVENIKTDYSGESVIVGVNGDMMKDCLLNMITPDVNLYIKDGKTIVLMRENSEETGKNNVMLLMPFV